MKTYALALIATLSSLTVANAAITFTNGLYTNTFDLSASCPEQSITQIASDVCDGLDVDDYYTRSYGYTQIYSTANYSGGGGGGGYRHRMADEDRNNHTSELTVDFPAATSELWIRWYQRWESGMTWNGQIATKHLYIHSDAANWFYFMIPYTNGDNSDMDTSGFQFNGGVDYQGRNHSGGWTTSQGGSTTADGGWTCWEVYIKVNSADGVGDGIFRTWRDGVLIDEIEDFDFYEDGGGAGSNPHGDGTIVGFDFGANHDTAVAVGAATSTWEDFDDLAVALPAYTGFTTDDDGNDMIGPLTSNEPTSVFSGQGIFFGGN